MDEFKEELTTQSMVIDNNNELDKTSNTSFGETVLCNDESLHRLPDDILKIWFDYEKGLLTPTGPGEAELLLQKWFQNESISQLPTITSPNHHRQQPGLDQKRRRVDSDI